MSKTDTTPDHGDRAHAEYSPSSLKYVAKCAGYEGREGTNEAAEKGTRIHEALEVFDPSALHDEEEVDIYNQIVEMENNFLSHYPSEGREDFHEIRLNIALKHGLTTFGTCDRFSYWPDAKKGVMGDYKTGVSPIDPVAVNWQTKCYVVGAFQEFKDMEELDFAFYVPFHDGDTVSEKMIHTFYRGDVPMIVHEITEAIKAAMFVRDKWNYDEKGNLLSQPELGLLGPSQNCRFCAHEDECPAMGALIADVAAKASKGDKDKLSRRFTFDPSSQEPEEVQKRWIIAKIVGAWADREKRAAVQLAKDGMIFPDLELKSMGATTTVEDAKYFVQIADSFGLSLEEMLPLLSFPLAKIKKEIEGGKTKQEEFVDACENAGILKKSAERFTLKDR